MATKLALDEVMAVIHENVKDPETKKSLLDDLRRLEADKQAEKEEAKEDGPKAKNKHVFFVRKDEKGNYSEAGWIAKVPQDSDNNTLLSRIQTAAAKQNDGGNKSGRGRKSKVGKISKYSEFFAHSKRKFTKESDIQPLKDLAEVIVLPTEEIDFSK